MKNTHTTAGQTATRKNNTRKNDAPTQEHAQGVAQPQEKKEPTKAQKAAEAKARRERAHGVAERIKAEQQSISGVMRAMWQRITEEQDSAQAEADSNALADDVRAVLGLQDIAEVRALSRKDFTQHWLHAVWQYCTAVDEKGAAVSVKACAGMVTVADFVPTLRSVYVDVVSNWVRGLSPMKMRRGVYYTRKGRTLTAVQMVEAHKRIAEAEARAQVLRAGAKAGRAKAAQMWEAEKAKAEQGAQ